MSDILKSDLTLTGEKAGINFEEQAQLDVNKVSEGIVSMLNLLPISIRKVDYRVCSPNDLKFREEAVELERLAYNNSKYGERAEGQDLFGNQYRGAKNHGDVSYLGIYTKDGRLAAFFNFFQHRGIIFDQTRDTLASRPDLHQKPIVVISKIARHPEHSRLLYDAGMPHRTLLSLTVFALAHQSQNGILIETQAQPDTRRMLQEKTIQKYFPLYEIALSTPTSDADRAPHIMLLHFPHMSIFDYMHIARGIVNLSIKSMLKRWEQ